MTTVAQTPMKEESSADASPPSSPVEAAAAASKQPSLQLLQETNWQGRLPVRVTLAPSSVSSHPGPLPIHSLVERASYLHTSLKDAVILRLHAYAPTTLLSGASATYLHQSEPEPSSSEEEEDDLEDAAASEKKDTPSTPIHKKSGGTSPGSSEKKLTTTDQPPSCPICWFQDEESGLPLRWHLFAGVLYDLMKPPLPTSSATASPTSTSSNYLPWKLILHFTAYPDASVLLPLEAGNVERQIQAVFDNSLKQALTLCHFGDKSQAAQKILTKQAQGQLWQAVQTANVSLYQQVVLHPNVKENAAATASSAHPGATPVFVPVRLYIDAQPPLQRPCRGEANVTLGQLLANRLPHLFVVVAADDAGKETDTNDDRRRVIVKSGQTLVAWKIAGLQPSLDTPLLDLWRALHHPDQFLYITVQTR